jgi:mRNA-degrading endonuclease toxin of MazEF toxin-antitoxin module
MAPQAPTVADVRQWEIWWVVWQNSDATTKERPALAISSAAQNVARGYADFVKITSQDHPSVPLRLLLSDKDANFKHTGLARTSWIHYADNQQVSDAQLCGPEGLRLDGPMGKISIFSQAFLANKFKRWGMVP